MKFVKCIGLFFLLPLLLVGVGFYLGNKNADTSLGKGDAFYIEKPEEKKVQFRAASTTGTQLIDADTHFYVEEVDMKRDTVVESEWELPDKYIGMDREQFITAMDEYELTPPLSELQRGFVSLEVKSFSKEQVVVRMNYSYTAPSTSFYIMVEQNYIVVYCDDKKTLYMKTNIMLDELSEELQHEIINGMFVEDEKTLYYFLESYSS